MTSLVIAIAACVLAEGFFSGSEIAMVSANRSQLEIQSQQGDSGAALALKLLADEHRLISTCLIGTNLSVVTSTTLIAILVERLALPPWLVLLNVPLSLVFAETLPKTVFQYHATVIARRVARSLCTFQFLLAPLLAVAGLWSNTLRRAIGAEQDSVKREDIVQIFEEASPAIDPAEHKMIRKVFDLPDVPIEDCMTPLVDIMALPIGATVGDGIALAVRHGYSRLPVYRDRIDNIVGVVQHQDLLFGGPSDTPIERLVQPVTFVPETKRADDLLHEMRRNRSHFAVVVDEYGGSVGIVSIEDLLEEFVGDIRDERDGAESGIRKIGERAWRVNARAEVDMLAEVLGRDLPDGDYETVAGLVLARTGRIPRAGEVVEVDGMSIRIEEATDRSITTVRITLA